MKNEESSPMLAQSGLSKCKSHSFDSSRMEVLTSICDTFSPSLPLQTSNLLLEHNGGGKQESLAKSSLDDIDTFYRLSASAFGIPAQVAEMMEQAGNPKLQGVVKIVLWLLSSRAGSFLLCGRGAVSRHFPFIHSFPTLPQQQREAVLLSWANSSSKLFSAVFKIFKIYTLRHVYYQPDENGWNPHWNALGYKGPDPRIKTTRLSPKPLEGKVIDVKALGEDVVSILEDEGFKVLDDVSDLRSLWDQNKSKKYHSQKASSSPKEIGISCDVVVVGSGAGGGVIAGVLAKAGYKVLVLEKGRHMAREDLCLQEKKSFGDLYESKGYLTTNDGGLSMLAGATVGGGTAVNWAAAFRTPEHVRKEWANKLGLPMFTSDKYDKALDEICKRAGVQPHTAEEGLQNAVLRNGCQKLEYHVEGVPQNAPGDHSCGWCSLGCRSGGKQGTQETWLVDAVNHGALILSNCYVEGVIFKAQKSTTAKANEAVGVVATLDENSVLYVQARVTVVSCGSLHTPNLLFRSGLGHPEIGRNLHLHPVCFIWGYFPEVAGPPGTCYEGGILTSFSKVAGNWDTTGYGVLLQTPSVHPGVFACLTPWCSAVDFKERMRKFSRTSLLFTLTRDQGGGRILPSSNRKHLDIEYHLSPADKESMMNGAEKGIRVLMAAGALEVGAFCQDGEKLDVQKSSARDIEDYIRRLRDMIRRSQVPLSSAHQMGSCRMGKEPRSSVVDPTGETWEVKGLYLGDASVFPTASGTNPMITCQSIAYCTAQSIEEHLRR